MDLSKEEVDEDGEGPENQVIQPSDLRRDVWLRHREELGRNALVRPVGAQAARELDDRGYLQVTTQENGNLNPSTDVRPRDIAISEASENAIR